MANINRNGKKSKGKRKTGDKALIAARERLDKKRMLRDRSTHWAHFWNTCPKCGGDMFEHKMNSILFDVCRKCHGIYIDKLELDLAVKFLEPEKILKGLSRKSKKPATENA